MAALLALALHATVATGVVRSRDGVVRLGDVAVLHGGDRETRRRLAARPLMRLPAGVERRWSRAGLASLVRRAAPGLRVGEGSGVLVTRVDPRELASPHGCVAAARDLAAGVPLGPGDVTAAACPVQGTARVAIVRRASGPTLGKAVAAGTPLGRLSPSSAAFRRGDALVLRSTAGAVAIERQVTAAQDGHAGRAAFVRDDDGHAFAVPVRAAR